MMQLPVINECNRCGACCTQGGPCKLRTVYLQTYGHTGISEGFEGRCCFLEDNPDGTTTCLVLAVMQKESPMLLPLLGVNGQCDFPDLKTEIKPKQDEDHDLDYKFDEFD